jgi:hypothetical protein
MNSNPVNSECGAENKIDEQAIRKELERLLQSPIFVQSDRLARFLRFTVEITLAGEGATLKEYLIGTEVYDRRPPYHPSVDSIVRSEARRLRNKLRQYYESAGKDDPVFIYYRTGSYVPAFRPHRTDNRIHVTTHRSLNQLLAETLIDQTIDLSPADRQFDIQIVFEGTVRIVRSAPKSATPAVVSMSAKKPLQLSSPRNGRLYQYSLDRAAEPNESRKVIPRERTSVVADAARRPA